MNLTEQKALYRNWCVAHPELSIFMQPWWLDTVCGPDKWNVSLSLTKEGEINGVLPYYASRKLGNYYWLRMPPLTPRLGPWIAPPKRIKPYGQFVDDVKVLNSLLESLPSHLYAQYAFNPQFQNGLPLYWYGWKPSIRYTFVLKDLNDKKRVFQNFKGSLRTDIRRASEKLTVRKLSDVAEFYHLHEQHFQKRNFNPYPRNLLKNIFENVSKMQCGFILGAFDASEVCQAAVFLVWDKHHGYHLCNARGKNSEAKGAIPLLLWEGMNKLPVEVKEFDLEGSMVPGIAHFFSSFGADLVPYLSVSTGKDPISILRQLII